MRIAEWIDVLFFSYLTALAWIRPVAAQSRAIITGIGCMAIGLVIAAQFAHKIIAPFPLSVVRDWLPAPLLLLAYWQAGQFFIRPMEELQSRLLRFDQRLLEPLLQGITTRRIGVWISVYLESAYLFCYPMVLSGLPLLYLMHMREYVDTLWATILPPTYLCYAALPFLQTLPPRMIEVDCEAKVRAGKIRALNLWILRHASIQVNTFPSAHVAASISIALVLLRLTPVPGLVFLWISLSVAAGAVMGRYHYAIDALLGAALAVAAFLLVAIF